ncbi:ribosomal protein S13 [Plasmodium falciparum RAJ116]|uniref:Ribosomal protein S13 n=1 Tax=Plasmodium falciparum RAJ116 TaxID=580058 RepID=A0A0L0CZZ4_PLAFA|nr:ribosomal protein S13 [Plasmodium falciparum RAJ116]
MGRMYGKGKGISSSTLPYKRKQPTKKGQTPSQIGATLRDNYGISTENILKRTRKDKDVSPDLF